MAVAVASAVLLTDGDAAFLRVDNRRPAHALEPGVAAGAVNKRFDQGKPGPRYGVACDAWGVPPDRDYVAADSTWQPTPSGPELEQVVSGLTIGQRYHLSLGNALHATTRFRFTGGQTYADGDAISPGRFTATTSTIYLWADLEQALEPVTTKVLDASANTCAYERFNDPTTDTDNGILITDDWRDGAGEDGGIGRAWRIQSGNAPQQISLNGHDVWGTARLVQAHNAMILLRHGNERHYFITADVDATADTIKIHSAPSWGNGTAKRVRYELVGPENILGTSAPAAGNYYYAKYTLSGGNHLLELYSDEALSNKMVFDSAEAGGRFYVELGTSPAPWFGNGAPALILQPNAVEDAFALGFVAVPNSVAITTTNNATGLIAAANHRLIPGDSITLSDIAGMTIGYVSPRSEHTFVTYATQAEALADSGTVLLPTNNGDTGSVKKTTASGLAMPPMREGVYINGRFWGIVGKDTIVQSDPFDFLHYTLYVSTVAANQGEAGQANWLHPIGEDVMLVGKDQKVIALSGISGPVTGWREGTVTKEYGGIAALAVVGVGTDVQFASRKGWASATRTVAGQRLGRAQTVSRSISKSLVNIDWHQRRLMCAEVWNGRLFWSAPAKGQETPVNNQTFVLNLDNSDLYLEQTVLDGQIIGMVREYNDGQKGPDSWEGIWTGDLLTPYCYAILTVNGEERLTFATPDGIVCWLHDGWDDAGAEISDELLTRGYFGSREVLALKGALQLETFNPSITASIGTPGVNEETPLEGFNPLTRDRTKYLVDGVPDYDPATSTEEEFSAPFREDYSPTAEELTVATLDTHQAITEPFRCRERDYGIQLRIANAQGSCRICGVAIQGKPVGISATRKT